MAAPGTHYTNSGATRRIQVALNKNWYRTDQLEEAIDAARMFNMDTEEGRRLAVGALDNCPVVRGRNLVNLENPGRRFPNTWDDTYVSDLDHVFAREFIKLRRLLTYRDTAIAKDSQVGRQQGAPATGVTMEQTSQALQDNKTAITETIIGLKNLLGNPESLWDQNRFERDLGLSWVA